MIRITTAAVTPIAMPIGAESELEASWVANNVVVDVDKVVFAVVVVGCVVSCVDVVTRVVVIAPASI
jgi:hypothetical protein